MSFNTVQNNTEHLLPDVDTKLFERYPEASYWVGQVAANNLVVMPAEYLASLKLRANVYVDEKHFLPLSSRDRDGNESDTNDNRSIHFAVIEKQEPPLSPRVVGVARLIHKAVDGRPLPVEELYPEVFGSNPIEAGSVEGSRLIGRHPSNFQQNLITLAGIRAMDLWAVGNQSSYIYGIAEKPLMRLLRMSGIPYEQLGDFKPIREFAGTENAAIRFDSKEVLAATTTESTSRIALKQFFETALDSLGQGYFDVSLHQKLS